MQSLPILSLLELFEAKDENSDEEELEEAEPGPLETLEKANLENHPCWLEDEVVELEETLEKDEEAVEEEEVEEVEEAEVVEMQVGWPVWDMARKEEGCRTVLFIT